MDSPIRVLLIEDSEDDAILLLRGLKHHGLETTSERVETSEEMTHALDNNTWDIILSDYNMPHLGALAALDILKDKGISTPLVIVSGDISPKDEEKAKLRGARDYVMKHHLDDLIATISRELKINPTL